MTQSHFDFRPILTRVSGQPADKDRAVFRSILTNETRIQEGFFQPSLCCREEARLQEGGWWVEGAEILWSSLCKQRIKSKRSLPGGNLRVPSLKASRGALLQARHALEEWRERRVLPRQRGRQPVRGVQHRGGCPTYPGGLRDGDPGGWGSGWGCGGPGSEDTTSASNAPPIKPKWGL